MAVPEALRRALEGPVWRCGPCLGEYCVLRHRVVPLVVAAARLASHGLGREARRGLLHVAWLARRLRVRDASLLPVSAPRGVERLVRAVVEEPERVVCARAPRLPRTGWDIVEHLVSMELAVPTSPPALPMLLAPFEGEERVLSWLVFCDGRLCLPAPRGLYPHWDWAGRAFLHGHADWVELVEEKVGALTVMDIVWDAEELALYVRRRGRWLTVTVYARVRSSLEEAIRAYRLQEAARTVDRLLDIELAGAGQASIPDILREELTRAVLELLPARLERTTKFFTLDMYS